MVPRHSTPGRFAYIWQSKWVGIIVIKTGRTQIHFLSDVLAGVLVAVASLDLKVPNFCEKDVVTRTNYQMFEVLSFGQTNTQVLK